MATVTADNSPATQEDWTLHAINIHGVFFERWCQHTLTRSQRWKIASTNYPVEFPAPNGPVRGEQSSVDILARSYEDIYTLTIECKKNNPDLVNWIFFPKSVVSQLFHVAQILFEERPHPASGQVPSPGVSWIPTSVQIADEARETKGDYLQAKGGQKTKTSNAAIQEAAHQVALARQAVFQEEISHLASLGASPNPPRFATKRVYIPIIVTTAKLFLCRFKPGDIEPGNGRDPACQGDP